MPRGEHRPSVLLSREENEQVFSLIGPKCQSLATAVVQIFTTEGPAHSEWKKRDTGVLCLIKDNAKRSYFFRVFCLYRKALIWEHEVYTQIEYKSPRPFLHTFEAEDYMTAFNFANETEAKLLRTILIEKIELRKVKREEKRQRALLASRSNPPFRQNGAPPPVPIAAPEPEPEPEPMPAPAPAPAPALPPKATPVPGLPANNSNYNTLSNKKGSKAKGGRKITKADIGMPQDFKHISHVGWDAQKGFDVDKMPNDELRSFLSKAGVSETQLQDDATREFIYGFIETHGGLEAVKEDLDQAKPAKGVSRPPALPAAPPVPERSPVVHPPAPPSRAPPPPPARAVPPPPAVPRAPPPPRPPQPPTSAPPSVPPPPPPGAAPPPPPPPPPLAPPPPPAPAAPQLPPDAPVAGPPDARAMLMESIRSGSKTLKRVEVNADPPPPVDDGRSNLLSDIRKGISLKKTEVSRSTSSSNSSVRGGGAAACGLAGALARALEERSRAIHSSESEASDNSDIDDDWD